MLETSEVTIGGLRLAYRATGAAAAPPMVLLHGLPSDGSTWDEVAVAFADTHRVYAPDLRGQGESEWPGEYSFELMVDDVLGFLDALGLSRVILVGHSVGGSLAMLFTESYPERVERLVIEDSPPPYVGVEPLPIPARPDGPLAYDWPIVPALLGQFNDPDPAWWDKTSEITVPTLVIAGGPASHVPQAKLIELARRIPRCKLVTVAAGHQIHRKRPAEFVAAVRRFLGVGEG